MNITFFIGNGFDLNLGLATTYSDFVKYYNTTKPDNPDNDVLKQFRKDIKDNEDKWSAAEIEMGKYTDKFDAGQGEAFNECHDDFCNHLAEYLQRQQNRIDYNYNAKQIERAIQRINSFDSSFPTQERDAITKARLRQQGEAWEFKFISFNYTDTLDKCVQLVKSKNNSIGKHKFNGSFIEHKLGVVYHVHGMTNKQMVFGVNDISQIANPKIFDCEYGDIYKAAMIKQQTNESYKENTDNNIA